MGRAGGYTQYWFKSCLAVANDPAVAVVHLLLLLALLGVVSVAVAVAVARPLRES